jgi:hypothetical protein
MKNLILVFCLLFVSTCYAELYVVVDKDSKEVITVSEKNDTVLDVNQELKVTPGNLSDFVTENPANYKFSGGKFIKNIEKIDKQERERSDREKKSQEDTLIQKRIRKIAIDQLKAEGTNITATE